MKTVLKVTAAKFELVLTRYRHNLKTVGNLTVKTRCRTLMLKKSTYTLRIDQSRSKSVAECSVYIIIECSHDAVSNLYRKIYPFRNLPVKNVPFSCEREAYPSHFSPFQNVPASCERNIRFWFLQAFLGASLCWHQHLLVWFTAGFTILQSNENYTQMSLYVDVIINMYLL